MPNPEAAPMLGDSTGRHLPEEPRRPPRVSVSFRGLTDPGKVRGRNEDHFLIARLAKTMEICATSLPSDGQPPLSEEEGYLIVVADGMGARRPASAPSALAVESVEAFVQNTLKWFLHLGGREERVLFDELRESLQRADRTLFERAQEQPRPLRHGDHARRWPTASPATCTSSTPATRGRICSATASSTRSPRITRSSRRLVDAGMISAEEARHHHRRHVVTNVLGGPSEGVHAEIHKLEVRDGDVLLFCSDGLTEPVPDAEIAGVLAEHADPQEAARTLVQQALDGGGPDNVTVVVARYQVDR